jgi:hypothetical protein
MEYHSQKILPSVAGPLSQENKTVYANLYGLQIKDEAKMCLIRSTLILTSRGPWNLILLLVL